MTRDKSLSIEDQIVFLRIQQDYFTANSVICMDIHTEGQQLNKDSSYLIGCRAAFSLSIENGIHEMAHFAEREIEKLKLFSHRGWGFTYGQYWEFPSLGKSGYEPQTDASVRRELRCWAYQYNIQQYYGIKTTIEEIVAPAVYINSFCNYKRYKDKEMTIRRSDKEQLVEAAKEVYELSKTTCDLNAFNKAWNERVKILSKK